MPESRGIFKSVMIRSGGDFLANDKPSSGFEKIPSIINQCKNIHNESS